jgi:retinol dehydrogenase-12
VRCHMPHCRTLITDLLSRLQVNCLSFALLSVLLLPLMVDTAKKFDTSPRIVTVSSRRHFIASFEDKMMASPNALEFLSDEEHSTPQ